MAPDPSTPPDPATSAVLTMELQRGVCGDLAGSPHLARAVEQMGVGAAAVRLAVGARAAGARVVHCTFSILPGDEGVDLTLPVMAAAAANPRLLRQGDPSTELLGGLGPAPGDLLSERHHGLTPFTGTDLGQRLRDAGVRHVVACGVSLNIGIPGLVYEAVGEGFGVTVATDAVVGLPTTFGDEVLANALGYVARLATVGELLEAWGA